MATSQQSQSEIREYLAEQLDWRFAERNDAALAPSRAPSEGQTATGRPPRAVAACVARPTSPHPTHNQAGRATHGSPKNCAQAKTVKFVSHL